MFRYPILFSILLLINILPTIFAHPFDNTYNGRESFVRCEHILQRKEWRSLNTAEKKDYINAVKCLQSTPVNEPSVPAADTLFDLFQGFHIQIALKVHFVGQFLMWHRYFLKLYENALRDRCNYKGAHPYWDWSKDVEEGRNISSSPMWDVETGFGGNGVEGTYTPPTDPDVLANGRINPDAFVGCVQDGPFADLTLNMGPGLSVTKHCLTRHFNESTHQYLNHTAVEEIMAYETFEDLHTQLEGNKGIRGPHGSGHSAVGGEMSNFFSSPGDPMFYMHHANLDRLWRVWQLKFDKKRMWEVGGLTGLEANSTALTLDYILEMNPALGPSVSVRDVMDTEMAPNCYTYL
ncbi:hypothetical protein CPB83DRAFT_892203 [Crepidotus variabilis]|uniref:Tyrosinase copper-binding domain-containing protein n=1 Tax=Crepidotus variabilis TaxID=179855 RepID=A0A9P6JSV9_9AGAR|nr:hypothetical protein CPB83DRAFT_892203 [Crepidotus variabilis]